jgi:ABC-type multidrug transport system fused ATPase/permease subunit
LRDAQLHILGRPTAVPDARSDHEVFRRFAEPTKGEMSLLTSHRFSRVRMADQILTLGGGDTREPGLREQLLKDGDHHARSFELQAAAFR